MMSGLTDEDMAEQSADAEVTSIGEVMAQRAADKGLPGLLEWIYTGRVL